MRSHCKGTTEFWTNDMPQDDTWEPTDITVTYSRSFAVSFPLPQNTVTSTEHECRDPHLPAEPHTENAEEEGRCVV